MGASSKGEIISGVHKLDDLFSHVDDLALLELGHSFNWWDGYGIGGSGGRIGMKLEKIGNGAVQQGSHPFKSIESRSRKATFNTG